MADVLSIRAIKRLGSFTLDVDIRCAYPVTALFGPSGAGKSTLLNLLVGLDNPDEGEIVIGEDVSSRRIGESESLPTCGVLDACFRTNFYSHI